MAIQSNFVQSSELVITALRCNGLICLLKWTRCVSSIVRINQFYLAIRCVKIALLFISSQTVGNRIL